MKRFFAAVLWLALTAACGGGSSGTTGTGTGTGSGGTTSGSSSGGSYTCQYQDPGAGELCSTCKSTITECDTYSGSGLGAEQTDITETCMLETTPTNPASCPTANRIGCCTFPYVEGDNVTVADCFYGTADTQTAKLPTQCAGIQGGVWTAS